MKSIRMSEFGVEKSPITDTTSQSDTAYGVDWSQRYGARCPRCGVFTRVSYKHKPWEGRTKRRYHVCPDPACGFRFRSLAEDRAYLSPEPGPEQLRFLRSSAP